MTIKQFQELYYVATSEDMDLDKSIKMVGIVTGKTPEQVEKMSMRKFNILCGASSVIYFLGLPLRLPFQAAPFSYLFKYPPCGCFSKDIV